MNIPLYSPDAMTCIGFTEVLKSNAERNVFAIGFHGPLDVAVPKEIRIVTTIDHPLPGNKLWVHINNDVTNSFNFIGYTDAAFPEKIVLRFHGAGRLGLSEPENLLAVLATLSNQTTDKITKFDYQESDLAPE